MGAETAVSIEIRRVGVWRAAALAAVVSLGAIALLLVSHARYREASLSSLITASSKARSIEGRLAGFVWAPLRSGRADVALSNAIVTTLQQLRGETTASARHATGVAQLLAGHHREALAALSAAAEATDDARPWSDLAAAYCAASVRYHSAELLAEGLAAADMALAKNGRLAEALFNRALVLERLGLRDDARAAWKQYMQAETDSEWLAEASQHLRAVDPIIPFRQILDREYDRLARDPSAVRELVHREPEESRIQGAMEVLRRWAVAEKAGDADGAARHLSVARNLGTAVASLHGDQMLARSVAVIDGAAAGARTLLAEAHIEYSGGIQTFWNNKPAAAQPMFDRAVAAFERTGSPMRLLAIFYAANTVFDQRRRDEAQGILESVLAETSSEFPACRAHILSQLGACFFAHAEWGASMAALQESAALFDRLGEVSNASAVRRLISIIYDQTGDREKAWKVRMLALRGLGQESNLRLAKAVSSIAQEAMLRGDWHMANSFLSVEAEIARRLDDSMHLAETLLFRAAVRHRLNDADASSRDLAEARVVTSRIGDAAYRSYLAANLAVVKSMVTPSPAEATTLLSEAIEFEATKGDRMELPRLYHQRARALRASGRAAAAEADLDRGMAVLETHRQSLPLGEARWGAFHAASGLFDDAIDLAMDRGDVAKAFAVAERARARSLIESFDTPPPFDHRSLPRDTVLVEYAALPKRLVIFVADASGTRAVTTAADRDALTADIEEYLRLLQSNGAEAKRSSAALYRTVIAPVAEHLIGAANIVFVPDVAMAAIPFTALLDDRGQYLVEQHATVVAPSAAVFSAAVARHRDLGPPRSVLVVSNSTAGAGGAPLPYVRKEAERVARHYAESFMLEDDQAQYDELARRASTAEAIHFAGHAVGDPSGFEPASIVLRERGRERRVRVPEIAALHLRQTKVVVLAGCSTARGERRGPEGVISVARGFLSAGIPSVVATLWPIDDQLAAEIFPRLHEDLAGGLRPAEALRNVQLDSIRRGVPASSWAALQVIGK